MRVLGAKLRGAARCGAAFRRYGFGGGVDARR